MSKRCVAATPPKLPPPITMISNGRASEWLGNGLPHFWFPKISKYRHGSYSQVPVANWPVYFSVTSGKLKGSHLFQRDPRIPQAGYSVRALLNRLLPAPALRTG